MIRDETFSATEPKTNPLGSSHGPLRLVLRKGISGQEKSEFCTQLSVMLAARIPLARALEIYARQAKTERMKGLVRSILKRIRNGESFSQALSNHEREFDRLFVITTEVGQETGKLSEVLSDLATHLEKIDALKRKLSQVLAYPALVLSVAAGAVGFLLLFIVPTFAEMFRSFQLELPTSTLIVLSLSSFLESWGGYLLVGGFAGLVAISRALGDQRVKERVESLSLTLPLIGQLILKHHVARFCRTMGTLTTARVPLLEALVITKKILRIRELQGELAQMVSFVKKGRMLSEPIFGSRFFPPMVAQMVAVGEETSELGRMFVRVAEHYEREIDSKLEVLASIIEPVIILLLGLLVASILVSMYLPMFDMVNLVGGAG